MAVAKTKGLNVHILARRLGAAREAAGLTQTETALRCDLNLSNLNALERGKAEGIRGDTLYRLCQVLNVSADYLLGLSDNPRPRRRRGQPAAEDADKEEAA
jgi:transcriptional regulator with XRE-family HTH domain